MADVDTMTSIVPHALIMATRPTMVPVKNATNQYGHKAVLEKILNLNFILTCTWILSRKHPSTIMERDEKSFKQLWSS